MAWALWLSAPVLVTALAAVLIWLRGRPSRAPRTSDSIASHQAYLDALAPSPSTLAPAPSTLAPAKQNPPDQMGHTAPGGARASPGDTYPGETGASPG